MNFLTKQMLDMGEYQTVSQAVTKRKLPMCVTGLSSIHKAHIINSLSEEKKAPCLVVTGDEAESRKLSEDLTAMGRKVRQYPYRDFNFRDISGQSFEYEHQRIGVLSSIINGTSDVILTTVDALLQYTLPPKKLQDNTITLQVGQTVEVEKLKKKLVYLGYQYCEQVESTGQFAFRGGIIDLFVSGENAPYRLEFWGDEIDTITYFDVLDQRRTEQIDKIEILPCCEVMWENLPKLGEKIENYKSTLRGKTGLNAKSILDSEIEKLKNNIRINSMDKFIPLIYPDCCCLLDYFTFTGNDNRAMLFSTEINKIKDRVKSFDYQFNEDIKSYFEEGILSKGLDNYNYDMTYLMQKFESYGVIYLENFAHGGYDTPIRTAVTFNVKQLSVWSGSLSVLLEDLESYVRRNFTCVILSGTDKAGQTLVDDLRLQNIKAVYSENSENVTEGVVTVMAGGLSAGFEYPNKHFVLITHGSVAEKKTKRKKNNQSKDIQSLSELSVGDYVVHSVHGIGVFEGVEKLTVQGLIKDFIKIRYAKQDTLYVPVTQLDLVAKYIGPREDGNLKLHRLGGTEWQKAKAKVRGATKEIAKELIELYAKRMNAKGYAFSPDTEWQKDFEAHFEFTETGDQLRCIDEIKEDMVSSAPMDRLLCGDVGFGKTEVALRAAFKCVSDSKQCAILVPTTILAWQHYQTILKRMEGFPVRVGLLSRFSSTKQINATISGLKRGEVDIVVGTHRLISKDVKFYDLGLVIIDEEQRFGVAQKEKLKELCHNVDVLTLSATPIPRTLNMAMSGIRDMSVIEEAPMDRRPVQTYVLEHDNGIINDAIRKELRRGGQVYYLHNRVETIESVAVRIATAIPECNVAVAHGKMTEEQLSEVWRKLIEHEIDVLVCTTIIETGVDVPNCNTLIIENADNMGLSQLHQLRGRVGRSNRRAYAYLTFTRGKVLTEISQKRLNAIKEFTEFGSGFKIAMRDLEIRGAGNVLGAKQHGHMESVGYDLYLKLLSEAISIEKGEDVIKADTECLIDLQIQAHIPEEFIPNPNHRLDMYRRIAEIRCKEDAQDVLDEIIDRFGEPPESVKGLIDIALLRNSAIRLGINKIQQQNGRLLIYQDTINRGQVSNLIANFKGRILVSATSSKPYISIKMEQTDPTQEMKTVLDVMQQGNGKISSEMKSEN